MKYRINIIQKEVANSPHPTSHIPTSARRGATLLIAVIMASVMLSVGLGVYQRTYKELYFASFWKQVQLAFAAADSGFECALYFDLHPPMGGVYFATSSSPAPQSPIPCGDQNIDTTSVISAPSGAYQYATTTISLSTPYSFSVEVVKKSDIATGATVATKILSRGYNDSNTSNPRLVERGLRIDY